MAVWRGKNPARLFAMKDSTPYRERPVTEIAREQECMRAVFAYATPVPFIFEAFGGLGKTAQVMTERFPEVVITAADLDEECVKTYNKLGLAHAICYPMDALDLLKTLKFKEPGLWGASLDFNRFTILDVYGRREGRWKIDLIEAVVERKPTWIQITDSAVRYLHLNYQKYYCQNNIDSYIQTLVEAMTERWGLYRVTHRNYYAASYLLLTLNDISD